MHINNQLSSIWGEHKPYLMPIEAIQFNGAKTLRELGITDIIVIPFMTNSCRELLMVDDKENNLVIIASELFICNNEIFLQGVIIDDIDWPFFDLSLTILPTSLNGIDELIQSL